jgi:hypothetical protein
MLQLSISSFGFRKRVLFCLWYEERRDGGREGGRERESMGGLLLLKTIKLLDHVDDEAAFNS